MFGRLTFRETVFLAKSPKTKGKATSRIKNEGLRRWDKRSWMAFFYIVQDLENSIKKVRYVTPTRIIKCQKFKFFFDASNAVEVICNVAAIY